MTDSNIAGPSAPPAEVKPRSNPNAEPEPAPVAPGPGADLGKVNGHAASVPAILADAENLPRVYAEMRLGISRCREVSGAARFRHIAQGLAQAARVLDDKMPEIELREIMLLACWQIGLLSLELEKAPPGPAGRDTSRTREVTPKGKVLAAARISTSKANALEQVVGGRDEAHRRVALEARDSYFARCRAEVRAGTLRGLIEAVVDQLDRVFWPIPDVRPMSCRLLGLEDLMRRLDLVGRDIPKEAEGAALLLLQFAHAWEGDANWVEKNKRMALRVLDAESRAYIYERTSRFAASLQALNSELMRPATPTPPVGEE